MISKRFKASKIKIISIFFSLLLAFFILVQIICIVTHTTLPALITNICSKKCCDRAKFDNNG